MVLRRMDRIRISRGRIAIRPCGRRSAGRGGALARTAARAGGSCGVAMRTGPATSETPAAEAAAALYVGAVMHARLKPMRHRFSYRVMSLLIDLDRLAAADRQSPLFGVNRAALYSFNEADHG